MNDDQPGPSRQERRAISTNDLQAARTNHPDLTLRIGDDVISEALSRLPPTFNAKQLEAILDQLGNEAMEEALCEPADREQLRHVMRMANLPSRDWKILAPLVVIPDIVEFYEKLRRMTYACRYYNKRR